MVIPDRTKGETTRPGLPNLADRLAEEARAMFAHLPEGEIDDDEKLFFTVDAGRLIVWVPRSNCYYVCDDGRARRYQKRDEGLIEVTLYRDGHLVEFFSVAPHKREGQPWQPWMK